jgi:O-methyltransferase
MENAITFQQLGIGDEMSSDKARQILEAVKPFSMVHESGILFTIAAVIYALKFQIRGVFLECGTWKGGCAVAMLLAQREFFGRVHRPVYMLDSFEGLPAVSEKDGPLAAQWQAGVDKEKFFDNCKAAQEDLERLLTAHRFHTDEYQVVRGWFDATVPQVARELDHRNIAVLRLDGDWYSSTNVALLHLCPLVSEGGIVIVDDYYAWDGCARAVHDYLSCTDLPYRVKSLPYNFGAYFIKRRNRQDFNEF